MFAVLAWVWNNAPQVTQTVGRLRPQRKVSQMKQSNELYVLMNRECPECGGEGRLETMTGLTYDGAQSWKVEVCPHCSGDRFSWEPVKCPFCGDDILKSELGDDEGSACHASCLEESKV